MFRLVSLLLLFSGLAQAQTFDFSCTTDFWRTNAGLWETISTSPGNLSTHINVYDFAPNSITSYYKNNSNEECFTYLRTGVILPHDAVILENTDENLRYSGVWRGNGSELTVESNFTKRNNDGNIYMENTLTGTSVVFVGANQHETGTRRVDYYPPPGDIVGEGYYYAPYTEELEICN